MHEVSGWPNILDRLDCAVDQALVVGPGAGGGCAATVTAWERTDGGWRQAGAAMEAVIGRGGFVAPEAKREGDGGTPLGVYALSLVFGYGPEAVTAMPYRQVTAADRWIDDPASPDYNRWVTGETATASWEEMLRPDGLYRHGIVVEYNTAPVVPGKGSAIFVHVWKGPGEATAGCVALAEADLVPLIAWLNPKAEPVIVLGGNRVGACERDAPVL